MRSDSATGSARTATSSVRTVVAGFLLYGSLFADRLAPLFLADDIADALGASAGALALLPLAIAVGWTVGLAAGRWSNRILTLRQRIVVGGVIAAALSAASAAVDSYAAFLLLRAASGIGANIASPALIASIVRLVPPDRRGTALGVVQSSTRIQGSFVAPIVLAAMVAAAGWRPALLTTATALVVTALAVHLILPPATVGERAAGRAEPPIYHPNGRRLLGLAAAIGAVTFLWLTIVSQGGLPLLQSWLGIDVATSGRVLAGFGVGSTIAVLGVSAWSDRSRAAALAGSATAAGLAGMAVGLTAMAGTTLPLPVVTVLLAVAGLGLGTMPMAISVLPADAVAAGDVDRAVELPIISAELLGGALLPAAALTFATTVGFEVVLVVCGAAFLVLAAAGASVLRRPGSRR